MSALSDAEAFLRVAAVAYAKATWEAQTGVFPTEYNGGMDLIRAVQKAETKLHDAAKELAYLLENWRTDDGRTILE
jgi:hypothetical protein